MANYANQRIFELADKTIILHEKDSKEPFCYADWRYLEAAGRLLKGENFKVYMYFLSWYGKKRIDFSPTDVSKTWGIGISTAREAINVLIDKGFIEQDENQQNTYIFYPVSHKYPG